MNLVGAVGAAPDALAVLSGIAQADSLVYVEGSNVWVSAPEGSDACQQTTDGTAEDAYGWPPESNGAEVAAVGPGPTGSDGRFGANLYVMDRQGLVACQILTPDEVGTVARWGGPPCTRACMGGHMHARVPPDGTEVACVNNPWSGGGTAAWISTSGASGTVTEADIGPAAVRQSGLDRHGHRCSPAGIASFFVAAGRPAKRGGLPPARPPDAMPLKQIREQFGTEIIGPPPGAAGRVGGGW